MGGLNFESRYGQFVLGPSLDLTGGSQFDRTAFIDIDRYHKRAPLIVRKLCV